MNWREQREVMVKEQLVRRGITDKRVLEVMRKVPREKFTPEVFRNRAYTDGVIPLGWGQTISQPYLVALCCQLAQLTGKETVLDVGTGSGYQAAVLAHLTKRVVTIERIEVMAHQAKRVLKQLGYDNVKVIAGDGSVGVPGEAPFAAIVSAAAVDEVPEAWMRQLIYGGRLVTPINDDGGQDLVLGVKRGKVMRYTNWAKVRYVPLVKDHK